MQRFNLNDTAVILIDHQVGTNTWASSTPLALLQRNVMILARFAAGTQMPVVLTSSQETNIDVQGPLMPELQQALPEAFAARIKRVGVVNAWNDPSSVRSPSDHNHIHVPELSCSISNIFIVIAFKDK